MNDDLLEYLIVTDQLDEFLGLKEENETEKDEEDENDFEKTLTN